MRKKDRQPIVWRDSDRRDAKGKWQPGRFLHFCRRCDDRFIGGKFAVECAPCAYGDNDAKAA